MHIKLFDIADHILHVQTWHAKVHPCLTKWCWCCRSCDSAVRRAAGTRGSLSSSGFRCCRACSGSERIVGAYAEPSFTQR